MEHKDAIGRPFNTEAQRHRGTEGRIEHRTQNNNLFFLSSMFNSSLCASVLNGRPIGSLFESHVPLRLCDRRTILSILTILAILLLFLSAYKTLPTILEPCRINEIGFRD
jgi:hypothetical protein